MLLTEADIAALSQRTGISQEAFIERYTTLARNRRALSLKQEPDGACVFLKENRCGVYDQRPAQCREFPHGWSAPGCPAMPSDPAVRHGG